MTEDERFLFGGEGTDDPTRFVNNPDPYREPTMDRDEVRAMSFDQYADWLSATSVSIGMGMKAVPRASIFDMGNGMCVYVERLMFHWAMKTAIIGDLSGYEGRWCFEGSSPIRVLTALAEWKDRGFEGKPTGWRREPDTGLRRNDDGDPASEYHESDPEGWKKGRG